MPEPIRLGLKKFSNPDIANIVDEYRKQDPRLESMPVDPELHLELQLNFDIIPTPELQRLTQSDSYISLKTRKLWVDEFVYSNRVNRYRFSLAHEIGHIVLHSEISEKYNFKSVEDYISFIQSVDSKDYDWLEYQANGFAANLLAPMDLIRIHSQGYLDSSNDLHSYLKSRGINGEEKRDFLKQGAVISLSKKFKVSREVMQRRIDDLLKFTDFSF